MIFFRIFPKKYSKALNVRQMLEVIHLRKLDKYKRIDASLVNLHLPSGINKEKIVRFMDDSAAVPTKSLSVVV